MHISRIIKIIVELKVALQPTQLFKVKAEYCNPNDSSLNHRFTIAVRAHSWIEAKRLLFREEKQEHQDIQNVHILDIVPLVQRLVTA